MLKKLAANLIAHECFHFLIGLIVSIFIFWQFASLKLVIVVFFVTFLIDLDHLTEFFIVYGFHPVQIFKSFRGNCFREAGKMTIFFHSWEVLPLILFFGKKFQQWPLAITIVAAAIGHLLVDQLVYSLAYGMSLFQYFLIYRAWHRFNFWELCGGC